MQKQKNFKEIHIRAFASDQLQCKTRKPPPVLFILRQISHLKKIPISIMKVLGLKRMKRKPNTLRKTSKWKFQTFYFVHSIRSIWCVRITVCWQLDKKINVQSSNGVVECAVIVCYRLDIFFGGPTQVIFLKKLKH